MGAGQTLALWRNRGVDMVLRADVCLHLSRSLEIPLSVLSSCYRGEDMVPQGYAGPAPLIAFSGNAVNTDVVL